VLAQTNPVHRTASILTRVHCARMRRPAARLLVPRVLLRRGGGRWWGDLAGGLERGSGGRTTRKAGPRSWSLEKDSPRSADSARGSTASSLAPPRPHQCLVLYLSVGLLAPATRPIARTCFMHACVRASPAGLAPAAGCRVSSSKTNWWPAGAPPARRIHRLSRRLDSAGSRVISRRWHTDTLMIWYQQVQSLPAYTFSKSSRRR
jgi:hypothetical protein